jgi:peptidoglycan/xylan/chitin deacetylase (PgdA/CDA1 family)
MSRRGWMILAAVKLASAALWLAAGLPVAAIAVYAAADVFLLYSIFVPSATGVCPVITRFHAQPSEVWLTIDDGPDPRDTPRILDALDRHAALATFFVIGERAAAHPHLIAEILRRGHEVAHHTHTHPARTFWSAGPKRVRAELDHALAAMRRGGASPRWFRPPVGIKNFFLGQELTRRGLSNIGWNIRSYDSRSDDPARVASRVIAKVRTGSILLMHEGEWLDARVRVRAIELVLAALTERGFACVLPRREQLN